MPLLSVASVENTFKNASNSFISLGAKIDQTISFTLSLPSKTAYVIANTIDSTANAVIIAAEDIAENIKTQISYAGSMAEIQISKLQTKTQNFAERHHQMLQSLPDVQADLPELMLELVRRSAKREGGRHRRNQNHRQQRALFSLRSASPTGKRPSLLPLLC